MNTLEILLRKFGDRPIITHAELAELLSRSDDGLRISIRSGCDGAYAKFLRENRRRIGRQIYYRIIDVARLIDDLSC